MKEVTLNLTISEIDSKWTCCSRPLDDNSDKYLCFAYGDTREEALTKWAEGISNEKCSYWNL